MKTKQRASPKMVVTSGTPLIRTTKPPIEQLEDWLARHQTRILISLIVLWLSIRMAMFLTIAHGPLFEMYRWPASDNFFFDEWARKLAAGDWLNRVPIHPYHDWHQSIAEHYFNQHPDHLEQILAENTRQDSTFVPGKVLWNEWYGGNNFHQEPMYAYVLALFYALTGQGVYCMMLFQALLGIGSGILLWQLTRRHFGQLVALVTGISYLFCGIVLLQESLVLRTSWIVFFVLLTLFTFERALEKRTPSAFFLCGLTIGLAFLIQSTFLLFLLGGIGVYFRHESGNLLAFARNAAIILASFFLVYTPVIVRNLLVDAPLFGVSSVGAITFAAANVHDTKTISTWMPDAPACADIMGNARGALIPTVVETLSTHPSVASYIKLEWTKLTHIINGVEWPNNENYYFYKEMVPTLDIAFINFYWIAGIGIAGMVMAWYKRLKLGSLYLALVVQLTILLGFYVLGRFRCPMAVLLLPFAAFMVVECLLFSLKQWKYSFGKIILAGLCLWMFSLRFYEPGVTRLDATDYTVFYELNFFARIKSYAESGNYREAITTHKAFLDCQPNFVKNGHRNGHKLHPSDVKLLYLFAEHYRIHSYLLEDSGNTSLAAQWTAQYESMKHSADLAGKSPKE